MKNRFGDELSKLMKQNGYSQKSLATALDCSRTMIYSVLKGERVLAEDAFRKLTGTVASTREQRNALRVAYYSDWYPDGTMDKLCAIRDCLSCLEGELLSPDEEDYGAASANTPKQVLHAAAYVIREELKSDNPKIYTNYGYELTELDNTVYTLLRDCEKAVNFRHFISFEHADKTTRSIKNLFSSVRYMRLGYSPLYRYCDGVDKDGLDSLFGCFILTHRHVFQFSTGGENGIIISDLSAAQGVRGFVERRANNYSLLASFSDNVLGFKDNVVRNSVFDCKFAFGGYACIAGLDFPDIFYEVADSRLPNREMMVRIAIHHYKKLAQGTPMRLMSVTGLREFVSTGIVHEFPRSWTVPLSPKMRRRFIEKYIEWTSAEKPILYLYDEDICPGYNPYFSMECSESGVCIHDSMSDGDGAFTGECSIYFNDSEMAGDFRVFFEHVIRNGLVYTRENVTYFLNEMLIACDMLIKAQEGTNA